MSATFRADQPFGAQPLGDHLGRQGFAAHVITKRCKTIAGVGYAAPASHTALTGRNPPVWQSPAC
jgi:hypothetical protein